jgi:RsiW-degrading membrane proteinase PrsW (M82 family)
MATHFDVSGNPNGWSSRYSFFLTWYITIFFMNGMFYAISKLIQKIPESMINIPNKKYWFETEERKKESIKKVVVMLPGTAFLLNIFFSFIYESILRSNTGKGFDLPTWGMFLFIAVIMIFTFGYIYTNFKKPKT